MSHNHHDPMLPHGSDKCRCSTCGEYFNSTGAFSRHLVGKVGTPERYCLSSDQLTARGWTKNKTGHWITRAYTRMRARNTDADFHRP